jgi:hypothetical protein
MPHVSSASSPSHTSSPASSTISASRRLTGPGRLPGPAASLHQPFELPAHRQEAGELWPADHPAPLPPKFAGLSFPRAPRHPMLGHQPHISRPHKPLPALRDKRPE